MIQKNQDHGNGKGNGNHKRLPSTRGRGRPKNYFSLTAELRKQLQDADPEDEAGRTFGQVIVAKAIAVAKEGKIQAITDIFDRIDGRAVARIESNQFNTKERFDFSDLSDEELDALEVLTLRIQKPADEDEEGAA